MRRALAGALLATALAATAAAPGTATADLPEEMGYELVSPLATRGFDYTRAWLFEDGEHAVIGTALNDVNAIYPTRRTAVGWRPTRRVLTPPHGTPLVASGAVDVSADGSRVLVASPNEWMFRNRLTLSEPDGSWKDVGDAVRFVGGTPDLGRMVVHASWGNDDERRYPHVPGRRTGVFLWEDDGSADGAVRAIGADQERLIACGGQVPDHNGSRALDQTGVSSDARTVVLSSQPNCFTPDLSAFIPSHVFHWRDGVTTDLTAPRDGEPDGDSTYVGSTPDGESVFFRTPLALAEDDANGVDDLYRWDAATGQRTRLTGAATDDGSELLTSAISSDDGSRVWFSTQLAGGGEETLWVAARGEAPRRVIRATEPDWSQRAFDLRNDGVGAHMREFPTQTTPDGSALVFTTRTLIDGVGGVATSNSNDPGQIFRLTADGELTCVSCFADGRPARSPRAGGRVDEFSATNRVVSDDGRWIAFETPSALEPDDGNDESDVYVWHDGERSLISGGAEGRRAQLANVSARGDVLFMAYAELLPWIDDDHYKVYVARVGGGDLPGPADPRETCEGDGCQGSPGPRQPAQPGAASEAFHGPADADDPAPPFAANPSLRVRALTRAAKRRLVAGRAATLVVSSNTAGRVSATARRKAGRRWRRADSATGRLAAPGTARLRLRLGRAARAQLARRGALRLRVEVVHAQVGEPRRLVVVLRRDVPRRTRHERRGARA